MVSTLGSVFFLIREVGGLPALKYCRRRGTAFVSELVAPCSDTYVSLYANEVLYNSSSLSGTA